MDEKTTTDANGNKDGNPGRTFRDLITVCPEYADRGGWEKIEPGEWVEILSDHPEFADKCDWSQFAGDDWVSLLSERPEFADRCPKVDFPLDGIPPQAILVLLSKDPGGIACSEDSALETLSASDWAELLDRHPMLAIRCKEEFFEAGDWKTLVGKYPFLSDEESKTAHLWNVLAAVCPELAGRGGWANLSADDWTGVLLGYPMLMELFEGWEELSASNWMKLLSSRLVFEAKCYEFGGYKKLSGDDWVDLLQKDPSEYDPCTVFDGWDKIDAEGWIVLLRWARESERNAAWFFDFFDRCSRGMKEELASWHWWTLATIDPGWAEEYFEGYTVGDPWTTLTGEGWAHLLAVQPGLVGKCEEYADWCDWSDVPDDDWEDLLKIAPGLAQYR